jgi:hypothetical protein
MQGQQIWCDSRADGYSPDGREHDQGGAPMTGVFRLVSVLP